MQRTWPSWLRVCSEAAGRWAADPAAAAEREWAGYLPAGRKT